MIRNEGGRREVVDAVLCQHPGCDAYQVVRGNDYGELYDKLAKAGWTHYGGPSLPGGLDDGDKWQVFLDLENVEWRCGHHEMNAEAFKRHLIERGLEKQGKEVDMQTEQRPARSGLSLSRRRGESIVIRTPDGQVATVEIEDIENNKVRLRVVAPKSIVIDRKEIDEAKQNHKPKPVRRLPFMPAKRPAP